jgi:pimeloyl-ACP methyl ester carboxylesterase
VTAPRDPEQLTVPARGGELSVLHWPAVVPGAPAAVLLHGITSNALVWSRVAGALGGEVELFAPDLRGRAGSAGLPGPYGLAAHAEDVASLLDRVGPATLSGHSMGAFVAALAAAGTSRDRVRGLVLVDGGLPFPEPPGADVGQKVAVMLGPTVERLGRTFPDLAAVRAFWAAHPTVGPWVDVPSVAAFLARDVTGTPPQLQSSVVADAVRTDGADLLREDLVLEAARALPVTATLLWAPRGMADRPPGLYDEDRLARLGAERAGITPQVVPETNHDSILWASHAVDAVAGAVRRAAGRHAAR